MYKNKLAKAIFLSILCWTSTVALKSCAEEAGSVKTIQIDASVPSSSEIKINLDRVEGYAKKIDLAQNDSLNKFAEAVDKFVQCNIRTAWDDFKSIIENTENNDFVYITYANKMADIGLFDLAEAAVLKTKDKDLTGLSADTMKRFYYPRKRLRYEDEMFLADVYSNIVYNNQSAEATRDLLKRDTLLLSCDYANYLAALGYYKSNSYKQAGKYINIAIIQNPANLNYKVLKAKILAENSDVIEADRLVEWLKKQNLYSYEYERKIRSLEQFVLYKTKKTQWEKDYHLGYYYYIENDPSRAIRVLQGALSPRKMADNSLVNALMSEIYLSMNEFEKAADTAKKAHKTDRNNPQALITLGDLSYRNKDYKQALDYYKKAASHDKKSYSPMLKIAKTYQKLDNLKKAQEVYSKILKTHSDCWEAYYNVALLDKDKEVIYLKKALAVNPLFAVAWVDLARTEIDKGNFESAGKYLANAFSIDENDFRYYYYQGLINVNSGDSNQARYNFMKCLKLNKNFPDAKKALENMDSGTNGVSQDSI